MDVLGVAVAGAMSLAGGVRGLCGSVAASSLVRAKGASADGFSAMKGSVGCGRSEFEIRRMVSTEHE